MAADETLGRAAYELEADDRKLKSGLKTAEGDIAASGTRAESGWRDRMVGSSKAIEAGVRTGAKATAAGAALVFGAATKGGMDLQDVQARYMADTGASAEEAARAGRVINQVAGSNRVSLGEVGDAAAKIHDDLGATGEAADELTGTFVRFSRVAKQDAGGAVSSFDDILDAWGLTAADSKGIMDRLVLSHQKYGGSIADNETALAKLAPSLRAANLDVDDGIGLLNLFAASGVDSASAATGMTKALSKVKSPEELQQLITDISATEDPLLRAQKAADLFGAKAGPKLANALAGRSLDDFKVSMDEAAGSTDKAADALDSTFSAQIQKKISEAGAKIRQLGADFGPLVTGLASAGSLLGALKIDDAFAGAFKRLAGSGPVKAAAAAAGTAAGAVYQLAATASEKMVGLMSSAWGKIGTSPGVTAAAGGAGKMAGIAFSAAMVVGVAALADQLKGPLDNIALDLHDHSPFKGFGDWLKSSIGSPNDWQWPLGNKGAPDWARMSSDAEAGAGDVAGGAKRGIASYAKPFESQWRAVEASQDENATAMRTTTADMMSSLLSTAKGGNAKLIAEHRAAGNREAGALAQGIQESRQKPVDAMDTLRNMLKNALSPAKEEARLVGQLTSSALAKGLKSKDPAVRAQAEFTKQQIIDRLNDLPPASFKHGSQASKELARALKSKDPDVRAAAEHVRNVAKGPLAGLPDKTYAWGESATKKYAGGIRDPKAIARIYAAAKAVSQAVAAYWYQNSPAKEGPLSKMGGSYGWGQKAGEFFADGILASRGTVTDALDTLMGSGPSSAGALAGLLGTNGQLSIGGTARVEFSLSADAASALRTAGYSPAEVAGALRSGVDLGDLASSFRHVISMRGGS